MMMQVIENPVGDLYIDLPGINYEIQVVDLCNRTDSHNNPVIKKNFTPLCGITGPSGKLFFVKDHLEKKCLIVVFFSPDIAENKVILYDYRLQLEHCEYPVAYGWCELGREEHVIRTFLLSRSSDVKVYSLVNNWGDMNMGENINYDFYYREIDVAYEMGIDAVQIDDGWQCGSTVTTRIYREDGEYTFYHDFYDGFWEVDSRKFPEGLKPLLDYARNKKVKLGLWFAPDSRNTFANFDRDMAFLEEAYGEGFRYFKLDMVVIKSRGDAMKFQQMLQRISCFGEDVSLQIDVTGNIERLGFLCGYQYGKIFVENRFGVNRGYYPHLTLKNLWKLSNYFPAQLMQFEIPNRNHFTEYYRDNDLLAPVTYGSDYLFASVMVSNPLFWMEVQELDVEDRKDIIRISEIWKAHREALSKAEIIPIGDEPNGCALTGFLCVADTYGYIIALREVCECETFRIPLPDGAGDLELLSASEGVTLLHHSDMAVVEFTGMRQYVFFRYQK